jgi:hypothetical protein
LRRNSSQSISLRRGKPAIAIRAVLAAAVAAAACCPGSALAQAWYEGFESTEVSWQNLGGDARFTVKQHRRTADVRRTGERSEFIQLVGDGGTHVYFGHDVGRPQVIAELAPSVQILADRTGVQLLAEITLPRTRHPETGKPLTTLLRGTSYSTVGRWQQLRIDDLSRLLVRQTHILRSEFGPSVDSRQSYLSRIVLNVYGGPGETNVWIDDLDLAGYVEIAAEPQPLPPLAAGSETPAAWAEAAFSSTGDGQGRSARLDRSVLLVDDRPMFVRAARRRGEPLAVFKVLGFNAVWLDRFPDAPLLEEADRTGMWLISPAPPMPQGTLSDGSPAPIPKIGPECRPVLAWDLGEGLGSRQVETTRLWAEQIRAADSQFRRPLIARPESDLRAYSRIVDVLVIGRTVLGSSFELGDYAGWLRQRPQLARPGTPVWVAVSTDPDPLVRAQWDAISPGSPAPAGFSAEQLRLITYASASGGARGLLFESFTPFDRTDRASRIRSAALELLNLELSIAEPWLSGGTFVTLAEASDPDIAAAVFRTDRASLLLPIWSGRGAQQTPGPSSQRTISVVVPGVPESHTAYEMIPGRLLPVRRKRVTGGTRITLESFSLTGQVLLTEDPLAHNSRSRRAAEIGRRAAELQHELVELKIEQFESTLIPLSLAAPSTAELKSLENDVPVLRRAARESSQACAGRLAARDYGAAYAAAEEAIRPLMLFERAHWLAASRSVASPVASPAAITFTGLPAHWRLLQGVVQAKAAASSRLAGGDFEDLQTWLGSGWDHFQHSVPAVQSEANLAPEAARSGSLGLRISVRPSDPAQVPQLVETPPVWIASAPVEIEARTLLVIRGWVRIPKPITGSPDGLLIFDSIAGRTLAERIKVAEQWQEFTLYRACTQPGPVRVTFALSGLGDAYLDDIAIEPLAVAPVPVAADGPSVPPGGATRSDH